MVEASFASDPLEIFHNTQLQANIIIDQKQKALVIPPQFLIYDDSVRIKGEGLRHVQVGLRNDDWVEILSGIDKTAVLQSSEAL